MIRLGVFTDAHYAENLTTCRTRTCWQSLEKVRKVLEALSEADEIIQLGDLINACGDPNRDLNNICAMQELLKGSGKKCWSVLGNHDVEAAKKRVFLPEMEDGYYFFDRNGVRMIVLDGNYSSDEISYEDAEWDWTDSVIPEKELEWLRKTLNEAPGKAIVFCHQNLDERKNDPHVIRNADAVRSVLESSGKVLAVLQGHCHSGCRSIQNGILYHTFLALCEGDRIPFAMVNVEGDEIQIEEREM